MYTINADRAHGLIEVALSGMLGVDKTAAYISELRQTLAAMRPESGYRLVIDVSGCTIQSQDMVRAMGEHMAAMPRARAIAIVTGSPLARMQVRRLFTQPYARIAANRADGRAWVLAGIEPPADAPPPA